MTPFEFGIIGCIFLVVLLISSLPVAFAMAICGFIGFSVIVSPAAAFSMVVNDLFDTFYSYNLTVIPLFVFMGQLAFHTGISRRLFNAAYKWLGHLPGGLAMAAVGACTAFGAICGSGPATAATMAAVALPEMRRYNYSMELASGSVASGGSLGMLIPPSVVFIVYGMLTEQSIGKLFISGVLPGLMIAVMFCVTIYIMCRIKKDYGPKGPKTTLKEKLESLSGVIETLVIFVVVMGGMFLGIFTPTEGAAIGAFATMVVALVQGELTVAKVKQALLETIRTSGMVMIIVAGAVMFGHFLAVTRIPSELAAWLSTLPLPPWVIIFMIIIFYLIGGCFIDALALILLTIPIFYPVILKLGFDPIWFGVIIVVVTQMGVISPPVGINVYVVAGMERDIPLQTVFKGSMPFLYALIVASVILVIFPQIATVLPYLIK
jgi:C4-dicarboxylate transporter, DctM subunit